MAKNSTKKENIVHISRGKSGEREEPSEKMSVMRPFEEMERMFEAMLPRGWMRPSQWEFPMLGEWTSPFERRLLPRIDIIEHDADVVLRAQIPGVEKKDLNITMTANTVTIEGTTSHESTEEQGSYYRRECAHGSFTRQLSLPCTVDSEKTKAVFSDGMLEMTMPKLAPTSRHKVEIA